MKKLFVLIFILCFQVFATENKKITLQLSWLHQFQFAGYYIAKEKGFYKEAGLDVNIKEYANDINLADVIENNEAQFAIGRSSLLLDKINGKDIVALAAILQHSPMMLLVLEKSNIKTVKDLRNKNIMITQHAKNIASILAMLNANKLKDGDMNILPHSFNINDLITGKTDAMASYLSNEPILLDDKKIKYRIFHPKDFGFDFYNDILFTSSKFIKNNPMLTKNFYNATIKGWAYAFNNILDTSELIHKKYNTQNKSLIHLIKEGEILKKLAFNKDGKIGTINKERLKEILSIFKVLGYTNINYDLSDFIYEEKFNKKITFEIDYEQKDILLVSFVFIYILIIIIIYSLRKMAFDKKLLDSVINSTDDLIYYKDKNFKYLGCNKAFEDFVGKSKKEIIGKTIFDLFDDNSSAILSNVDKSVLEGNDGEIINEWVTSIEGKKIYFQTKKTPFKYSIKDVGVLGISRDLSKLKQLEDEHLKQQETLLTQSKITAMGEMLSNIAHQWRQPLSVITTNVSGLKLSIDLGDKLSDERIIECSDIVVHHAKYLSKTIDDFKSFFSSSEEDVLEFNIKTSIFNMEKLIKDSLKNEGIIYISRLNDCNITHNENILIQAFMNICNNAKDALVLSNKTEREKYFFIILEKSEDHAEIIFRDSGGGIQEDIIDKLFEPYFTTKHQSLGTGVGLYMTHQIITKHFNGTITVNNVEYEFDRKKLKGAEFIVTIPLKKTKA